MALGYLLGKAVGKAAGKVASKAVDKVVENKAAIGEAIGKAVGGINKMGNEMQICLYAVERANLPNSELMKCVNSVSARNSLYDDVAYMEYEDACKLVRAGDPCPELSDFRKVYTDIDSTIRSLAVRKVASDRGLNIKE